MRVSKNYIHVHVDAALSRGGGVLVGFRGGGGMSDLVMGGANGPSRAFSRDSGRGGAGNVSVEEVCIKGKTGLTWSTCMISHIRDWDLDAAV